MIDLHSHILPELDDGARDLDETFRMARLAVESGISHMVATPHCVDSGAQAVQESVSFLRQTLQQLRLPLKVYSGMEIYGTRDTAKLLSEGRLLTLNRSRYPLIEFDFESDGMTETQILHSVLQAGFRPLIAHPERYLYIQREPQLLDEWLDMGCLLQINKGSLTGRFGPVCQELSMALIARGFAAVVASDAHSAHSRTPWMYDAWDMLARQFSPLLAEQLLLETPRKILKNEPVTGAMPDWFR